MRSREAEAEDQRRQATMRIPFNPWSDPPPAGNLHVSNCKWSLKAKKLEVVAPAAAKNRTNQKDNQGVVNRLKCSDCEQSNLGEKGITACVRVKGTRPTSKTDNLTCLLLLSMPFRTPCP